MKRLGLVVGLVLAVAGCTDSPATRPGQDPTSAESMTPDVTTAPSMVSMPSLQGTDVKEARAQLEALGLRVHTKASTDGHCRPLGRVIQQHPKPGTQLLPASRVTLLVVAAAIVCLDKPPLSDSLRRAAELFVLFARGEHSSIPADTPVDLYVGGQLVKTLPSEVQGDALAWQGCPPGGYYAARTCPFSAVEPLKAWKGRITVTSDPPSHPCLATSKLPESLSAYMSVTVTPQANLDCISYFAIQFFVNDVAQIVAVNVVWAEP